MSRTKKIKKRETRRTFRVRNNFSSKGTRLRISVYRSLSNIYSQIIDDSTGTTVASYSSVILKDKKGNKFQGNKSEIAKKVGVELGKIAKEKSIDSVFFDRGRYKYHGRIAALADGLRENGLKF